MSLALEYTFTGEGMSKDSEKKLRDTAAEHIDKAISSCKARKALEEVGNPQIRARKRPPLPRHPKISRLTRVMRSSLSWNTGQRVSGSPLLLRGWTGKRSNKDSLGIFWEEWTSCRRRRLWSRRWQTSSTGDPDSGILANYIGIIPSRESYGSYSGFSKTYGGGEDAGGRETGGMGRRP
ncbi:hypothetical protein FPQ18DRAFT_86036 [Pyronema domesticum]|nr:hypothetical protein FPQ18DRAFT_86036 [Pyronema domesticum]